MNQKITLHVDQQQTDKSLSLIKSAVEKTLKLNVDSFRESAQLFSEFLNGSINFSKLLCVDTKNAADGTGCLLTSFNLTDSALYFFIALWAIEGNGVIVDDAHRKLLVDRLLGDVNPTTGSSSSNEGAP